MVTAHRSARVAAVHAGVLVAALAATASAAQTDEAIAMDPPGAAPHIFGPLVLGAVPGSAFVYTIAATGQRPMTFAAPGLPGGLALDPVTGRITGNVAAVRNVVVVTATNAAGRDETSLTIDPAGPLAPTPPMGWNSYDSYGASVTEDDVLAQAKAQLAVLQPVGFRYVVVDYRWFDPEDAIDATGRYLPSVRRFPSATGGLGFKPLADQIHAMGLNFGIHIMRGIPRKSVAANTPIAGSSFTASAAANTGDQCPWDGHMYGVDGASPAGQAWYDSIFAQYAEWGIDFVKVDDMIKNDVRPYVYHRAETDAIRKAIDKTGRSIVLSLSPGPMQTADVGDLAANAAMWRMVNDFWDENGLSTVSDVFAAAGEWQGVPGIGIGHWPDADMLPLGYMEPRCPVSGNHRSALTHNQQVTVMTLWSLLPSPLLFGGNVVDLTADAMTGPWTTALLTNTEVLAIDQDPLGARGRRVVQSAGQEVWAKPLSGGRTAVALFNRASADQTMGVTWAQLGLPAIPVVRDAWRHVAVPADASGLTANVPYGGALLYVMAAAGDAGADAATDAGAPGGGDENGTDAGTSIGAGDGAVGDSGGFVPEAAAGIDATLSTGVDAAAHAGDASRPSGADAGSMTGEDGVGDGSPGAAPPSSGASGAASSGGCGCVVAAHARQGPSPFAWAFASVIALGFARRRQRVGAAQRRRGRRTSALGRSSTSHKATAIRGSNGSVSSARMRASASSARARS